MLTPVVLAADYAETLQLSDRTDVRVRATQTQAAQTPTGTQAQPATSGLDLANQATAVYSADDRVWRFSLVYSPVVTLQDVQKGIDAQNEPQVLQTATGLAAWHTRRQRLTLAESVTYGHFNSAYLFQPGAPSTTSSPGQVPPTMTMPTGTAATPSTQLAPLPTNVYYGSTLTTVALSEAIDRRSSVTVDGGYIAAGGLDQESRATFPLSYGPRADASFGYSLSRTLRTVTAAHAEMADFSATQCYADDGTPLASTDCHPEDQLAQISQSLRDTLSRSTLLTVGAGVSYARFRSDSGAPYQTNVYPDGQASIAYRFGQRGMQTFVAGVQMAPLLDARTGLITYRGQAQATLIDTLSSVVTLSVDAAGAQTIPTTGPLAASIVRNDVEARFRADRYNRVFMIVGESAQWQSQGALGGFFSIYSYFAVTVTTRALRF
jgi:hypothetical protein